jgi:predicted ATPase
MIKELRVENWKSFERATLYIDPLTILIGENASGKSNLLEALDFLQRFAAGAEIDEVIDGSSVLPPLRGGIASICRRPADWFALEAVIGESGQPDCRYRVKVWMDGLRVTAFEESLVRESGHTGDGLAGEERLFWTERLDEEDRLRPQGEVHRLLGEIEYRVPANGHKAHWKTASGKIEATLATGIRRTFLEFLPSLDVGDPVRIVVNRVASALRQVFVLDPIASTMRKTARLSERLERDGSNVAGVLAALGTERRAAVEAQLTRYLQVVPERDIRRVWAQPVDLLAKEAMLYCEEGWPGAPIQIIDAYTMSDGTLRYLVIVAAMLLRPPGSLLVVEDVDSGLHPSRACTLLEMLRTLGKERRIDVLVTTHNPALLDAAGMRMVPFITVAHRDDTTGASRLTPLEDIDQLPKLSAGGSLGQLESAGRLRAAVAVGPD